MCIRDRFGMLGLFLLTAMFAIIIPCALLYVVLSRPKIVLERSTNPARLRANTKAQLFLEVQNSRNRYTPVLFAEDTVGGESSGALTFGAIQPGGKARVGYAMPYLRRGLLEVGPLATELQDPLGLFSKPIEINSSARFLVRPQMYDLKPISAATGRLKSTHKRTRRSKLGDEDFYALRPYVVCLLYTSPSPRDATLSRMPSSA